MQDRVFLGGSNWFAILAPCAVGMCCVFKCSTLPYFGDMGATALGYGETDFSRLKLPADKPTLSFVPRRCLGTLGLNGIYDDAAIRIFFPRLGLAGVRAGTGWQRPGDSLAGYYDQHTASHGGGCGREFGKIYCGLQRCFSHQLPVAGDSQWNDEQPFRRDEHNIDAV